MTADDPQDDGPFDTEAIKGIKEEVLLGVGYKRPPEHTRFAKGQSGNPRGRPRGSPADLSLSDQPTLVAVREAANRKIRMKIDGKVVEVQTIEAMIQAVAAAGLQGNARSQGLFLDMARTAEQAHARDREARTEFWQHYQQVARQALAAAASRKEPPPTLLPHPDDIGFDPVDGPQIHGPIDEREQRQLEDTLNLRDLLIIQDALDRRSVSRLDGEPMDEPGSAMLMAYVLDRAVPARLRLSDTEWILRDMRFDAMPKRVLMKELYARWRKQRRPRPRGYVSPNLSSTRQMLELCAGMVRAHRGGKLDLDAASRGDFDEGFLSLLDEHGYATHHFPPSRAFRP